MKIIILGYFYSFLYAHPGKRAKSKNAYIIDYLIYSVIKVTVMDAQVLLCSTIYIIYHSVNIIRVAQSHVLRCVTCCAVSASRVTLLHVLRCV